MIPEFEIRIKRTTGLPAESGVSSEGYGKSEGEIFEDEHVVSRSDIFPEE